MTERSLRLQETSAEEMSASIFSAFCDVDLLYKQDKRLNMNAIHINSMLDKKAVGAPLAPSSNTTTSSYAPEFFRRNSTSNLDAVANNINKYSYNSMQEDSYNNSMHTSTMNKDNKLRDEQQLQAAAALQQKQPGSQINSTRYKTELCRPFEENGACKYGEKCQFAHGYHELRSLVRHPKYKTEPCRTYHTIGFCPYGPRCHFIHNAEERRGGGGNANAPGGELLPPPSSRELCVYGQRGEGGAIPGYSNQRDRPKLYHSLSFSGFSSAHHHHQGLGGDSSPLTESPTSRTPPPSCYHTAASSSSSCSPHFYEDVLSLSPSPSMACVNSAFSFPRGQQDLKALLAPLTVHTAHGGGYANNQSNGAYYASGQAEPCPCPPSPPSYNMSHLRSLCRLSDSPVFDAPPSPPDSLSGRESFASGSLSTSGSLSGSESPSLDAGKRLPIFSRLSISDD